jgi:hypothetical protein
LPVQLLWLNLVTNGIQGVAIAFEPGEGDTLKRKPRSPRRADLQSADDRADDVAVLVMGGVGFGAFHWMIANGWNEAEARNVLAAVDGAVRELPHRQLPLGDEVGLRSRFAPAQPDAGKLGTSRSTRGTRRGSDCCCMSRVSTIGRR